MYRHVQTSRRTERHFIVLRLLFAALLSAGLALTALHAPLARAATITVTTAVDEVNADGDCSLREAIRAANLDQAVDGCAAGAGADTISLPAGNYVLSIGGVSEDAALTGDLDITDDLTMIGSGAGNTTVDANGLDRVLQITGQSIAQISGVTIEGGNPGFQAGSGISVYAGTLTLTYSRVRNNTNGSGIFVGHTSTFTLISSRIEDNAGHGIDVAGGATTIINSTISGNTATSSSGGGISNGGGTLTLVNSTISGNSANFDGGGISSTGTTNLYNVTITSNTANADGINFDSGGGISAHTGAVNIRNSIIAGNLDNSGAGPLEPDCVGTLTGQGYNLIENTTGCTIVGNVTGNITGVSPSLGPLQNNGGPTFTHALLAGSVAIDAGNSSGCLDQNNNPLTTDQRVYVHNGTCDMGAYEYNSPGAAPPTNTPTATRTPTRTPTVTRTPGGLPEFTPTATAIATPTATAASTTPGHYRLYLPVIQKN